MWQKRWVRIVANVALWVVVALVFTSQLHLYSFSWLDASLYEGPRWLLWAVLLPVVLRLAQRFPLQKGTITRHLAASLLVSLIHVLFFVVIFRSLREMAVQLSLVEAAAWHRPMGDVLRFAFALDFHIGVLIYWLILLVRNAWEASYRENRLRLDLAQSQLHALKMQIHPHFLFNTLNSIAAMLRRDPDGAEEMIGKLADLLRITLRDSAIEEVTLSREVELVKIYLEIEQVRFKDRLQVSLDVMPDVQNARVPTLILQPIVENAIRHGVSARLDAGKICIRARRENGTLSVTVEDDGPGIGTDVVEGVGLSNTRARLQRIYGQEFKLDLVNDRAGGLQVRMEIPCRIQEER